ncbi:MAG: glutamate synthase subunit alpha, partial [Chloroflexi bacterium]|nr:glutamate synthase subunit alpha [Chloroflexota bacterium]
MQQAVQAVSRLGHRGAIAADRKTGDGAGVLTQLPREFFAAQIRSFGERAVDPADIAVAMVFLDNRNPRGARRFRTLAEEICGDRGIRVVGWRQVPVDTSVLGAGAYADRPDIQQALLVRGPAIPSADEFESRLYLARRELTGRAARESIESNYVVSMSSRTIVYKGLVVGTELGHFYPDLS